MISPLISYLTWVISGLWLLILFGLSFPSGFYCYHICLLRPDVLADCYNSSVCVNWLNVPPPLSLDWLQLYFHGRLLLFSVCFVEPGGCSCSLGRILPLCRSARYLCSFSTRQELQSCYEREVHSDWMQFLLMLLTLASFPGLATRVFLLFFRPTIWKLH